MAEPENKQLPPSISQGHAPSADPGNCSTNAIKGSTGYRAASSADNVARYAEENDRLVTLVKGGAGFGATIGGGVGFSLGGPIPAAIGAGGGAIIGGMSALLAGGMYQLVDTTGDDIHNQHMKDYVAKTQESCLADLAEKNRPASGGPSGKTENYNSLKTAIPFGSDPKSPYRNITKDYKAA